jgi:hypothetical protein
MKRFGIVILHPDGTKRLFGRVTRADAGDIYVNWEVVEAPAKPGVAPWKPHASYHASGQIHSKSHNRIGIKKYRPVPNATFKGVQPIEATNADRALSNTLPCVAEQFDDVLEIDSALISGAQSQAVTVDAVEPGQIPIRLTGKDTVIAEKTFPDAVPWIVVSLVN